MYEAYWQLSEPPFDNSPNPKFFYLSPEHEEALVRLVYTVRHRKGCGMLTGEYGCGKTTLSRALIQRLEAERYEIGLLTNPSWNAVDFLREALYQLGVESRDKTKSELLHQLITIRYHLNTLDYTHTAAYVTHRLKMAGRATPIFTDEAIKLIFDFTRGTPREINNLCDVALLVGYTKRVREVGEKIVAEVIKDQVGIG